MSKYSRYGQREHRSSAAQQHAASMEQLFANEIRQSVDHTKRYNQRSTFVQRRPANDHMNVGAAKVGTVDGCMYFADSDDGSKTAFLDFASFKNPGGGFLNGSSAQEEAVCAASDLFNILIRHQDWYDENRRYNPRDSRIQPLYANRGLYVPDVVIRTYEEDEWFTADAIVVAAPNWKEARRRGCDADMNDVVLEHRIRFVCEIAEQNEVDNLVLGAFGCGVFQQSPSRVAYLFSKYIYDKGFSNVVFAVVGKEQNVTPFFDVFGEYRYPEIIQ